MTPPGACPPHLGKSRLLALAFFLPQFHRVAENDAWWGPGFTEWTHMARARSWYPGHTVRQPVPPLGRYDLLDHAVLEAQADLATAHGLDGFLVWDYWFGGGRRLLERPVDLVLTRRLRFPYALAWANHAWVDQLRRRVLAPQQYLGAADYGRYFDTCLPHFRSERYQRVDGCPVFYLYRPHAIPDLHTFVEVWRERAARAGLPGLHLIGDLYDFRDRVPPELDAYSCSFGFWTNRKKLVLNFVKEKLRTKLRIQTSPQRFDFETLVRGFLPCEVNDRFVPTVLTGWDTTPRHGRNGVIVDGLAPATFRRHLEEAGDYLLRQSCPTRLLLVKSWNEWAEGNVLEPDQLHGDALLREFSHRVAVLTARLQAPHPAASRPPDSVHPAA